MDFAKGVPCMPLWRKNGNYCDHHKGTILAKTIQSLLKGLFPSAVQLIPKLLICGTQTHETTVSQLHDRELQTTSYLSLIQERIEVHIRFRKYSVKTAWPFPCSCSLTIFVHFLFLFFFFLLFPQGISLYIPKLGLCYLHMFFRLTRLFEHLYPLTSLNNCYMIPF